jgi:hypothetical protein
MADEKERVGKKGEEEEEKRSQREGVIGDKGIKIN